MATNFVSRRETDEECIMHSKSDNIKIMITDRADEAIEELFHFFLSRCQIGLKTSMKTSDFITHCAYLLYHKCCKINFKRGGSYIDSPEWIKNKEAPINPINTKHCKLF